MNTTMKLVLATAVSSAFTSSALAEVPNTFTANTPAKASEVNANFTALDQDISSLGTEVDDLTDEVDSIEASEQLGRLWRFDRCLFDRRS